MKKVVAHGTFDILHYGHINYLEKAKSYGDYLIVLVTADSLAKENGKNPYFSESVRLKMIASLKCVNEVILRNEHVTNDLLKKLEADVFVTTDPKFNDYLDLPCEIKVIPRTEGISSTLIKEHLVKEE